ncbi:hypothetical protein Y032_0001g317 [Ancylostoma ceylanicum]|uniref:Uncharacterized protein n=1 Tax=Ancylostoma ceylanicum TaxID=53326 RepID=A0A016W3R9_9BILA|nr:hypothetical protein Y032_0001g317 [Ancylostoma ceylanicum]
MERPAGHSRDTLDIQFDKNTFKQLEMDECFKILNEQSQYIKLTRETPRESWLPFLNTQLKLSRGMVQVKWYHRVLRTSYYMRSRLIP